MAEWIRRALVWLLLLAGCGQNPVSESQPGPTLEERIVLRNAYFIRDAAETWAAESGGRYPTFLSETSGSGNTLADLLPYATPLENPYTGRRTVPVFRTAVYPGEVGYRPFCLPYGTGYLITACGLNGELIRLSNLPQDVFYFQDETIANCRAVRDAVELFTRDSNGRYPSDTGSDMSSVGKTVIDYLPGGARLANPYYPGAREPSDGAGPGVTRYFPAERGSIVYSYAIVGYGDCDTEIVRLSPSVPEDEIVKGQAYRLMAAIEEFASQNAGIYPRNLDRHKNAAGQTVINLLGNELFRNAYTGLPTEPRHGVASSRGEIGYEWSDEGPTGDGYTITAWGFDGELVRILR